MKYLLGIILSLFFASAAYADGGITVQHTATIPVDGGQVIVLQFVAEDFDLCLNKLTVQTNIGTGELDAIGCSTATIGGDMRLFHPGALPSHINIVKATGLKDGKMIDVQPILHPAEFKPVKVVNSKSGAVASAQGKSQGIDALLNDLESMVKIMEKYNGSPIASEEETKFVAAVMIKLDRFSQDYPEKDWSAAQLARFRALATRLSKVPPTR